jgi:hypothetical protein
MERIKELFGQHSTSSTDRKQRLRSWKQSKRNDGGQSTGGKTMNGKKPTRQQRKLISENGLYHADWLVTKNTPTEMHLVHRYGVATKIIYKEKERG